MNISPVNPYASPALQRIAPRDAVVQARPAAAPAVDARQAASHAAGVASGAEVTATAPKGTDEKLWSVLTSDERSYFARAGAPRTLTYGASGDAGSLALRGRALNLRV